MATAIPPAIIFVNDDLVTQVRNHLVKQLHINAIYDGYAFDGYIETNPAFVNSVYTSNMRIMVIRPFTELTNRSVADIVIFVKAGLASVLDNKFGLPSATHEVVDLTWGKLGKFS